MEPVVVVVPAAPVGNIYSTSGGPSSEPVRKGEFLPIVLFLNSPLPLAAAVLSSAMPTDQIPGVKSSRATVDEEDGRAD